MQHCLPNVCIDAQLGDGWFPEGGEFRQVSTVTARATSSLSAADFATSPAEYDEIKMKLMPRTDTSRGEPSLFETDETGSGTFYQQRAQRGPSDKSHLRA